MTDNSSILVFFALMLAIFVGATSFQSRLGTETGYDIRRSKSAD